MEKPKSAAAVDTRTFDRLLEELRTMHSELGANLQKIEQSTRLSEPYHDALADLYSRLTLLKSLAEDLQAEMDRLDDQLPED